MFLMTSCLGSDGDSSVDDWTLGNAQISSFSLSHDSIDGLSGVKFTIDQLNSLIYNKDSMPYGTVLHEKVLCTLSYDNSTIGVMSILFVETLTGDSVWGVSDSIDFTAPVMITVYPYDGVSTKTYKAQLNIHQVNPDTMTWHKYGDLISGETFSDMKVIMHDDFYYVYAQQNNGYRFYRTTDLINWEEIGLTGFPDKAVLSQMTEFEGNWYVLSEEGTLYVTAWQKPGEWVQVEHDQPLKTLLGSLPENTITGRVSVLSGITEDNGVLRFISLDKNMKSTIGTEVPGTFPLSGFGNFNYESMYYPRLVIASGRDSNNYLSDKAWATMDGLSWASLSNNSTTFTAREGAAVSYYDDCFFVMGGIDASGEALDDIFYSKDQGVTWTDTVYVMAEDYTARGFSSVVVDENNYILLFGGKAGKNTNVLNELWRGRINRLGFGKD